MMRVVGKDGMIIHTFPHVITSSCEECGVIREGVESATEADRLARRHARRTHGDPRVCDFCEEELPEGRRYLCYSCAWCVGRG